MHHIHVKPFSNNRMFKGKKYKTLAYENYERALFYNLDKRIRVPATPLKLTMIIGCDVRFDVDNALKPFIDVLQKRYGFNDNTIYRIEITKKVVKKGNEFIKWKLESFPIGGKESEINAVESRD